MHLHFRGVVLVAVALLAPAISQWFIRAVPSLHRAELLIYDWHVAALPATGPDDRLVLVGMDQESLSQLPIERPSYPLPRTIHAAVVRELHAAGARAIAFDVTFTRSVPAEDAVFADALSKSAPVFAGAEPHVTIADGREDVAFAKPATALRPYVTACSILAPPVLGRFRWFMPDSIDAVTMERYVHLTVALAETQEVGIAGAPRGGDGEVLIRFAGPAKTYTPVPIYQVYDGSWRRRLGPDFFRGKSVLIGIVDPLVDRALTPVGDMQGVEVLAQAAQTILQANWIRHWSEAQNYVFKSVLCLVLAGVIWVAGLRWALLAVGAECLAWTVFAHRLFVGWQVWADTMEPIAALALVVIVSSAYEAGRLRRVFRRFMPSRVAEQMLSANPSESASTRPIEATVAFCDVRSSTQLAETLPPDVMEELLRRYFIAGEDAARRLGTELDKFVGDEIMLYFEDMAGHEPHALRAVRWALDMQHACEAITRSGLTEDIGFRVGVGICTGPVRVGTVGARQRIQHTVMGDAVNTASRLQTLTKELDQPIVMCERTWLAVSASVEAQCLGDVAVRGKIQPLRLYTPIRVK